jgi:hypothetical protein
MVGDLERLSRAQESFAKHPPGSFGKIMPIWMAGTLLFHLSLLWLTWRWPACHTVLLISAVILWIIIVVFSIIGPVPINDRVIAWDVASLPAPATRCAGAIRTRRFRKAAVQARMNNPLDSRGNLAECPRG